ncbi:hypothetical protein J8J27_32150, partial [Mycobacterium tuberculosis]|nr:hypothetical protein [Mycobacterium tuberculosis]
MDQCGYSGWAAFSDRSIEDIERTSPPDDVVEAAFAADRARVIDGNLSKYAQPVASRPVVSGPAIFVALQTAHDA